jgi:RimJ/RimL family protein N-acetyltransferase
LPKLPVKTVSEPGHPKAGIRLILNKPLLKLPNHIETERLYLRPYQDGDGSMYYAAALRNRGHLAEFESGNVLMQIKDAAHAEAIVRELAADWEAHNCFFVGIFEKETNDWVGQVYVGHTHWNLPEFTIGYVADVEHEGKGYISEAVRGVLKILFEDAGAQRVCSDCNENNVRSWRLLERCGFTREGHLRENKKNPDGSFHGDFLYGLLRSEFKNLERE